jgi:hypothetical protein
MRRWFLSYHSPDQALAERLKAALERKDADARVFFAPSSLRAGRFWSRALAEEIAQADAFVLLVGEKGVGDWQVLEYDEALEKRVKLPDFPVILVLLEGQTAPGLPFLHRLHWIVTADPASEKDVGRLIDAAQGSGASLGELWRYTSPYRGLAAMEEKDSDYFFGRQRETVDVLATLASAAHRLPVLLGNSGVGKSSLAQAGVLAALKRQAWPERSDASDPWPQAFRESRRWCFLTLKPGTEPLKALVQAFLDTWQLGATDPERVRQQNGWIKLLRDSKATLSDLLDATERRHQELDWIKPPAFLLYVDQGEELYVRAEEQQRRRFSQLIAHGVADPRVYMLMSMRTDFLGELQKDEPLYQVRRQIDVPPLREPELRDVVSRPAEMLSAGFESGELADLITRRTAEDTVKDVGALPLLSYTLDDMWTQMLRRGDGVLRLPAQSFQLGGVLVDRADAFLAAHPDYEAELRRIFTLKLATVREGEEPTRRRAQRSEFTDAEWRLVCDLADHPNRLLVTVTPEQGESYAEVAHEAVFRRWKKLRDWIAKEHEFLAWKTGLETTRRAWQATPDSSKSDALLMGVALVQAQSWFAKRHNDIPEVDRNFIELSAMRDSRARARARRTRRAIAAMSSALMLGLLAFFAGSYFNWRNLQPWGLLIDLFDGQEFELKGDSISIGRSAGAINNMIDVSDAHKFVSRLHLFVSRDRLALDARSLNGTTVNAQFLQYGYDKRIEDGDTIVLAGTATFQFRSMAPPVLPFLQQDRPKYSPPPQGTWALLIDGKNGQTTALSKEEYFLSAGANGAASLDDAKQAGSLLYIKKPGRDSTEIVVANIAQEHFLTAVLKYEDRHYFSIKMPAQLESNTLNEELNLIRGGGISNMIFCFRRDEQPRQAVEMEPDKDLSCEVGPLQIVVRTSSGSVVRSDLLKRG